MLKETADMLVKQACGMPGTYLVIDDCWHGEGLRIHSGTSDLFPPDEDLADYIHAGA